MKRNEEVMEILEAFDLTETYESVARLAGCDPKTVAHYVALRDAGKSPHEATARDSVTDAYRDKIEEWVEHSKGDIRADVVHRKLQPMAYAGSERTTRRPVAAAKDAYERGHRRVFPPSPAWTRPSPDCLLGRSMRHRVSPSQVCLPSRQPRFVGGKDNLEARQLI